MSGAPDFYDLRAAFMGKRLQSELVWECSDGDIIAAQAEDTDFLDILEERDEKRVIKDTVRVSDFNAVGELETFICHHYMDSGEESEPDDHVKEHEKPEKTDRAFS